MANALKTSNGVVNAPPQLFQVLRDCMQQKPEQAKPSPQPQQQQPLGEKGDAATATATEGEQKPPYSEEEALKEQAPFLDGATLEAAMGQAAELLEEIGPAAPAMAEAKGYLVRVDTVSLDQVKAEFFQYPLLFTNCVAAHDAWRGQKDCGSYICKWASMYKKEAAFQSMRKSQEIIQDRRVLPHIEQFFSKCLEKLHGKFVDIQKVSANWGNVSYIFGFDVGIANIGVGPNCASLARYLLMGEVEVVMIDMKTLVAGDTITSLNKLKSFLQSEDITAKALCEKCPAIHYAVWQKDTMLVIPAGFIIVEYVRSGPLCYGLRKSFFTEEGKEGYKKSKEMLVADGRDVETMEDILKLFK